ncbi:MAG: NAD-dependent epimerase/dehydratase family protein [Desulfotomaculaceae bacterium]|nr:NAD-dependent epimerase/dehydratase family protein [Desulfotomaculaceae bacterium]
MIKIKTVLITGAAGFIGSKVSQMLLEKGYEVIGVDHLNDYYDVKIKMWRLNNLMKLNGFRFYQVDLENFDALNILFQLYRPDAVINEGARAGVRASLANPFIYFSTNAGGNLNLLELCRRYDVPKFVLASTSSLYAGQELPFHENLPVNTPISPYAASKKSAEAMAYTYHYLYGLDVTIFRYFTVYGPAGRPDMSYFRFIWRIMDGTPLEVFGDGKQSRDFTYIDDIARGTIMGLKPVGYEIINLGNSNPHLLSEMIQLIEKHTGRKAKIQYRDFPKADMTATRADIRKALAILDWQPLTGLAEGIKRTVEWSKGNWDWVGKLRL